MRKLVAILVFVSSVTIFSCVQKIDIEADKETLIRMSTEDWDMNVKAGNLEANVETYAEDAVRIGSSEGVLVGKEAIRNAFKNFQEKYNVIKCDNQVEDIRVSGDLAVIRGSFSGTFVPKEEGEPIKKEGLWVTVYQRQTDGSWKKVYSLGTQIKE